MTIQQRIIVLVCLTLLALVSIGGYSVVLSRWNAGEVRLVTEGVVPSTLASSDLVSQLKDLQLATVTVVTAPDQNLATQSYEKLSVLKKQLQASLETQAKGASDEVQKGLVKQAQESAENYLSAVDQAASLKLAGQGAMAEAVLYATVAQYQEEMAGIVETLRIEKNRTKDHAFASLNQNLSAAVTTILALTILAVLTLGLTSVLLYRQIIHPIRHMQEMMSEIAASQDFTRRVPVGKQDEIGQSIMAFNVMIEKIEQSSALLKQKTNDIQTMLQHIPQGILTITRGNKVHPEYSAYLETILETQHIAGATCA